jgi:putative phosphonate metabolism protein
LQLLGLIVRYAIYFSPAPDSLLTRDASRWLGRDAFTGKLLGPPDTLAMPVEHWHALVTEPRRYGFHATLKAPFELRQGRTETELMDAFEAFAAAATPFEVPRMVIGQLGPFFALVPHTLHPPLQTFAASVVEAFEPFRAPLSDEDVARRLPERLTEEQRANLARWGYPYVMEEFRFHMTLTGPVDDKVAPQVHDEIRRRLSDHEDSPLAVDGLALFIERSRGEPFTVHHWQPLGVPQDNRKLLP